MQLASARRPDHGPSAPLPPVRWLILFLTSWVLCGNFWAYDVVAALNLPLEEYLGFGNTYFQYLLSAFSVAYSLPNCILPFIGGALIDRWGSRTIALSFCVLSTLGQFIFTVGLIERTPGVSIFGRLLFGIGGETLSVCQQRITTKWFRGGELALAVGVNLSVARLGSVINDFVSPVLAHRYSVPIALWGGFLSCALSLVATIILVCLDRNLAHVCPEKATAPDRDDILLDSLPLTDYRDDHSITPIEEIDPEINLRHVNDTTSPLRSHYSSRRVIWHQVTILKRGIKSLPRIFWVIQVIMVSLYGTTVPFNNIHSAFLCAKYYPDQQEYAAQIMGVPDTISAILVPYIGYYFDKYGYRARAIVMCSFSIFFVHMCLGAVPATVLPTPIPPLIILGIAYALLLTFVPVIPLIVPSYFLGTAYGISTSLSNFAWAVFPVITAGLAADDPTYFSSEMFFATCALFALIASVYVNILDSKHHAGILNRSTCELPVGELSAKSNKWMAVEVMEESVEGISHDVQPHISSPSSPRHHPAAGGAQSTGLLSSSAGHAGTEPTHGPGSPVQ